MRSWLRRNLADDQLPVRSEGPLPSATDVFTLAFEHSPIAMAMSHILPDQSASGGRRSFVVNQAMADLLGLTVEELLAAPDQGQFTHPDDRAEDGTHLAELMSGTATVARWQKRYLHADGRTGWGHVTLSLLRHPDGSPWFSVAHVEDVTARRELEALLRDQAETDELTGLLNRRAFRQAARIELARLRREGGVSAVVMIDLDLLKRINDTHGHRAGDEALQAVAAAIRHRVRAADVCARLGGDEFVVLLSRAGHGEAQEVAAAIQVSIAEAGLSTHDGQAVTLSASAGVAIIDRRTEDVDAALAVADEQLLLAKRSRHD